MQRLNIPYTTTYEFPLGIKVDKCLQYSNLTRRYRIPTVPVGIKSVSSFEKTFTNYEIYVMND